MEEQYTAEQWRGFIAQCLENVENLHFLKSVYSLVAIEARNK